MRNLLDTYIVTWAKDNLNIDGKKYAQLLENNRVKVFHKHYDDDQHGFVEIASTNNFYNKEEKSSKLQMQLAKNAVDNVINWITRSMNL